MHRHASLNRIFRLVWSHVHQTWVIASEVTRGKGKKASRKLVLATTTFVVANLAQAGPVGGQVTAGSGTVVQNGTVTTITQSSQNLSLNWQSFNTTSQETVNFVQPSASAIAVNRILDTNPTQFLGSLNANGQVYLINPNGVLFGAGSQINVGGLVASTLDVSDASLNEQNRRFTGTGKGSVINHGTINVANGGYVAFIANTVSNQGAINAPRGAVAMGAGSDVTLSFSGNNLLGLQVNQSTLDNLAENGGLIKADGGTVLMSAGARDSVLASVVNNTGIIQARSVQNVNGLIVLEGGGASAVTNAGTLDASGKNAGESGGTIKVLGEQVALAATSNMDVSGDMGGGNALVGGNFLGMGPEKNAQTTTVAAGSVINADAIKQGDGGQVVVWSDGTTSFNGKVSARGGRLGGNGGSVETSGKQRLKIGTAAAVSTLATLGRTGDWLLDPQDISIGGWGGVAGDIDYQQITNALGSSNVTIKTGSSVTCTGFSCPVGGNGQGDIILLDGISIGTGGWIGGNTLTLSAFRNIVFQGYASIDASNGTGNVVLRADNSATGVGTVMLGDHGTVYGNATGSVEFYYNPASYSAPTDYANRTDPTYGNQLVAAPNFKAYMLVNVTANIANKTYDGNATAAYSGLSVLGGLPPGITVDFSQATASFASKNAGINKAVTISGVSMTGANAGDYALNGLDSKTATINRANLSLSGVTANNKTYDGTTAVSMSGTPVLSAAIGSDVVTVSGTGAGSTFSTKDAGVGKAVTVAGYTLGGAAAGNYNLVAPTNLTADVARANLVVTGVTANNKTYDGTSAATLSGTASVTALLSDVVSVSGTGTATFANKNAGNGKAVAVSGYSLTGTDAANYNIVQPAGLTATINKADLSVTGITANNKTYDTTTAATLTGTASVTALGSDAVSVTGTGVGTFSNKNAGSNKTVTVSGYSLTGSDAVNYNIVQPTGVIATINKANLNVSGISANNKTYDATTTATLAGTASVTALGSDVVSVTGTGVGSFANKNAGNGKAVAVSGYSLGGTDAGNYNIVQPTGLTATINKADLNVTGITANNKTYDGTSAATLSGTASVTGLMSDVVGVSGTGTATFADKNAGNNKAVAVYGYSLSGTDANNYNIVQPTGLTATIDKAGLALSGLSVADKVYDGTTSATLTGAATVTGIGADQVSVSGVGSATFANKNAGNNKAVVVGGYTLSGADAGNYTILPSGGLSATIGKADLYLQGLTALSKTYDGGTAATISGIASVSPLGSDVVTLGGAGSGTFVDKNAGSGKAVTVSGYTLGGPDGANYNLVSQTGLTASIARANVAVTGISANNKTYDGGTAATLSGTALVVGLGSDQLNVGGSGVGSFASKNVGNGKSVTVSGYILGGADANNYNLVQPTGLAANISKADLIVTGVTAADKTYDGTTVATLNGTATIAAFGSDIVNITGAGNASFSDKNAAVSKAVAVTGYAIGGADATNYNLIQPTGLTADITQADLLISGLSAQSKVYDGTTSATLSGTASITPIGADVVTLGGTGIGEFSNKNAGVAKAVSVQGYTLSGSDAANYRLVSGPLSADITPAALTVSGITAVNKFFDGTTSAIVNTNNVVYLGKIGADEITVSSVGNFSDAAVGQNKTVNLRNTFGGVDSANYVITDQLMATASITGGAVPSDVQNTIASIQGAILTPQSNAQAQSLTLSSTIGTSKDDDNGGEAKPQLVFAPIGFGSSAPSLSIQNGGVQLPGTANNSQ